MKKQSDGTKKNKAAQHGTDEAFFDNSRMAWTYPECAWAIGVSENALRKMVHRRQIPFTKLGKRVRFIRETIEAWLKQGATHVS